VETNAFAIKIYMETIVSLVQLLEYGTFLKINVFVQLQKQSGVESIVNALQECMVIIVSHAQHQDIGIQLKINAFAEVHLFGMELIAHVLNHIF